jgi:hypothetical protein
MVHAHRIGGKAISTAGADSSRGGGAAYADMLSKLG